MLDIKHIQQVNDGVNWKCGAVCLEMIFRHYNIPCNQDDIWESIKSPRPNSFSHNYARTCDLTRYSNEQGLPATIYKTNENNFENALQTLDVIECPAILSIIEKKSNSSHFIVYIGYKNNLYYFCDPNVSKSFTIYNSIKLQEIWKPCPSINVTGYIFVAFGNIHSEYNCPFCGHKYPIVQNELAKCVDLTICPNCDRG